MKNKEYNGFKNYAFWNISLWINGDYELYFFALECLKTHKNTLRATRVFIDNQTSSYTPDGVRWTSVAVHSALISLKKDII